MEKTKGQRHLTLLILIGLGIVTAVFAQSKWLPLSCVLLFLGGGAIIASASLMLSLAQLIATDAIRGRVMSVNSLAFRAGIPLGSLALGKLIPVFGISTSLAAAGVALVAVSVYFLFATRDVLSATPYASIDARID
jgi:predicted MFS family arabinose efflux permease